MSSFYQSVIRIISKPSEARRDEDVLLVLNWFINLFRKKAAVFGEVDSEVIKDIIKNCSFETKKRDEIIIRQGDAGDCFYINLRGKVSIYMNHKEHDMDESDTNGGRSIAVTGESHHQETSGGGTDDRTHLRSLPDEPEQPNVQSAIASDHNASNSNADVQLKSKRLRESLGNFVTSLGAGEGFGEVALVCADTRSASIIADELTDLMVVNKTLYTRCLQAPTLRMMNEKQQFINKSLFFGNWSAKMKKLLGLCLERDIVPYDSYLGKQGETADRIFFIITGQAKVTVNPALHRAQYPRLYPLKLPENEEKEIISSWME